MLRKAWSNKSLLTIKKGAEQNSGSLKEITPQTLAILTATRATRFVRTLG